MGPTGSRSGCSARLGTATPLHLHSPKTSGPTREAVIHLHVLSLLKGDSLPTANILSLLCLLQSLYHSTKDTPAPSTCRALKLMPLLHPDSKHRLCPAPKPPTLQALFCASLLQMPSTFHYLRPTTTPTEFQLGWGHVTRRMSHRDRSMR